MLVYFLKNGKLWDNIKDKLTANKSIEKFKLSLIPEQFCENLPRTPPLTQGK